ncbi:hypothetical protein ACFL1L_00910 [Thermoplasmatota archaeon]
MKIHIVIGLTFVLILVGFSGCIEQNGNENKDYSSLFIGSWERPDGKPLIMYENGSYFTDASQLNSPLSFWGTWNVIDDTRFLLHYQGETLSYTFEFVNDNKFIVTDIESGIIKTYSRIS